MDRNEQYRKQAADGATLIAGGCALIMLIPLILVGIFLILMLFSLISGQ